MTKPKMKMVSLKVIVRMDDVVIKDAMSYIRDEYGLEVMSMQSVPTENGMLLYAENRND